MAPKKRRGRKLADEALITQSFETSYASGAGECGESESVIVSSSLSHEEQPATVSPVVGDRKLSSAVLVLENCLLPASQHASVASPGSFPLEGLTPKLQPALTVRQRASSVKGDAGDGSFTNLALSEVTDKTEAELESGSRVPKPKRTATVRRKRQRLKAVMQIVPGQLDIGVGSSEAERNTCATAQCGVGTETNLGLEAESLRVGDETVFEAENFVAVKKRRAGAKKEKRTGKRQKSDRGGAGTAGAVEPVAEDEENGTTWVVSPSGGDEERVILKRRRKVTVSQDLTLTDVTGTGLLNADVGGVAPECPGSEFQNSSEQTVAQDKIIEGEQTVIAAVETEVGISRPDALGTEVIVKKKRARKLGKRMAKNISLDISETDAVEIAGLPVKKRTRFKRKSLKSEEDLEPSRAVISASVSTRVTRSRSNGNGGTPNQMDSSQNVAVNASEETAETNLPENSEGNITLQTVAVEGGSVGIKEILPRIENTEKELLCDAGLHLAGVETEEAGVQPVISQDAVPKTYTEPTRIASALESFNTVVVNNGISLTEINADSLAVGTCTVPSNQETSEQGNSVTQHSSDERATAVPDRNDQSLQKTNTSLPQETISLQASIESAFKDRRGESSSLEHFHDNENIVPPVALEGENEPLASDVVCLETPPPEKLPPPCDDLSDSAGCRIKRSLSGNTDANLCTSLNNEGLLSISSSANSTALAESGPVAVQDAANEFSVRNRTVSVSESCLDMATAKPVEAVSSSATVGPVILSVGSADVFIATERSSSVRQTSNVPRVDGRNESGASSEFCSEGTDDKNLSASDVLDTSKTKSDMSEATEDLAGHSTSDGLESDAKTVAKDALCNSDNKKLPEGGAGVTEETGFVPLKKRRLRMAESVSEFVAVDVKCSVASDATNRSSELGTQGAVCIGGLTTAVTELSRACALPGSTLRDADAIARQRKYVGAHVSTAGGLPGAVLRASQMGARAFALFIKPQKTWTPPPLDEQEASVFRELLKEKGYSSSMVVPHGSYLLNCGASNAEHLRRSREALVDDLRRCQLLGLSLFNFHPGSFTDPDSADECIDRVAESINYAHGLVPDVITVIENSCGEMNAVGGSFSQLKQIIDRVTDKSRIGICLDTCHAFASGYDLRAKSGYVRMMEDFDTTIGRDFLKAVHINDSKDDLGSHLDHHASIGKGKIGLPGFQVLMADRSLENIPIILETPLSGHKHEIELLYSFVSSVA